MKTLLSILLLSLLAGSCKKRNERCWSCHKDILNRYYEPGASAPYQEDRLHEPYLLCEKTENQIRAYESQSFEYTRDSVSEYKVTVRCE